MNLLQWKGALVRSAALMLLFAAPFAAIVPFDPTQGLVEIAVVINGKAAGRFGIDTGADHLYIDKTFAERNGLHSNVVGEERSVTGAEGSSSAQSMTVRSLEIEDLPTLTELPATIIDIGGLSKAKAGQHPDGLIGFDVLSRFFVTVDYPDHEIELGTLEPRSLAGKPRMAVPFETYKHLILVDALINGKVHGRMILDYCANYTTVSRQLAAQLGLDSDYNQIVILSSVSIHESASSTNVKAAVSDMINYRSSQSELKFDGILGGTFLASQVITIDYAKQVIYVHAK